MKEFLLRRATMQKVAFVLACYTNVSYVLATHIGGTLSQGADAEADGHSTGSLKALAMFLRSPHLASAFTPSSSRASFSDVHPSPAALERLGHRRLLMNLEDFQYAEQYPEQPLEDTPKRIGLQPAQADRLFRAAYKRDSRYRSSEGVGYVPGRPFRRINTRSIDTTAKSILDEQMKRSSQTQLNNAEKGDEDELQGSGKSEEGPPQVQPWNQPAVDYLWNQRKKQEAKLESWKAWERAQPPKGDVCANRTLPDWLPYTLQWERRFFLHQDPDRLWEFADVNPLGGLAITAVLLACIPQVYRVVHEIDLWRESHPDVPVVENGILEASTMALLFGFVSNLGAMAWATGPTNAKILEFMWRKELVERFGLNWKGDWEEDVKRINEYRANKRGKKRMVTMAEYQESLKKIK